MTMLAVHGTIQKKVKIGVETDAADAAKGVGKLKTSFKDATEAASRFGKITDGALERIGHHLTDTIARAPGAIADFTVAMANSAKQAEFLARSVGGSVGQTQALLQGFRLLRIDTNASADAIRTLQENLGELERLGTGPAKDALGSLGLTIDDFAGKDIEDRLKIFAEALKDVENPAKQLSIALEVMGDEGGRRLLPALQSGAKGVDELTRAARESGQVLSAEAIAKTRELDIELSKTKAQLEGAAKAMLIEMLPAVKSAADGMQEWIGENEELIKQDLPALAQSIAEGFGAVASALVAVGQAAADTNQWFIELEKSSKNFEDKHFGVNTALFGERALVQAARAAGANPELFQSRPRTEAEQTMDAAVAATDSMTSLHLQTMRNIERSSQATRRTLFEINEIASQHQGGGGGRGGRRRQAQRDNRPAHEILGFADPGSLRDQAFVARREESREQAALRDPFSAQNLELQQRLAEEASAKQLRLEQAKSDEMLQIRLNSIALQQEQGVDPLTLIQREEQARTEAAERELEMMRKAGAEEADLLRQRGEIRQIHHDANMKRIKAEADARAEMFRKVADAARTGETVTQNALGTTAVVTDAVIKGEERRLKAKYLLEGGASIATGTRAAVEAGVAYATGNIPQGVALTSASIFAFAQGAALLAKAGQGADFGGASGAGGGAVGGSPGGVRGRSQDDDLEPGEIPISTADGEARSPSAASGSGAPAPTVQVFSVGEVDEQGAIRIAKAIHKAGQRHGPAVLES